MDNEATRYGMDELWEALDGKEVRVGSGDYTATGVIIATTESAIILRTTLNDKQIIKMFMKARINVVTLPEDWEPSKGAQ